MPSELLRCFASCLVRTMYVISRCGWLASLAAVVFASGAAAAQDFRSGLSAYNTGDYPRAFHDWFGLAEHGDPAAEAGIGFLFHKGLGVMQDDAEAARWFVKAAEQGQAEAQLLLGTLFFFGRGVPQSYVSAFAWCDIAETNGQSDASECRDAALEHLSPTEMQQSFNIVSQWFQQHTHSAR
jgi:TPR repeat protein